jgi:hypothetical protein
VIATGGQVIALARIVRAAVAIAAPMDVRTRDHP